MRLFGEVVLPAEVPRTAALVGRGDRLREREQRLPALGLVLRESRCTAKGHARSAFEEADDGAGDVELVAFGVDGDVRVADGAVLAHSLGAEATRVHTAI